MRLSFINLARNVLEILYMPHLSEKNFGEYIEIDHLERLTDALAEGHGVAIVTGHIGTWEWLSAERPAGHGHRQAAAEHAVHVRAQ